MEGKVILVGGGTSDGLLTVRGKQEIQKADVLIFDDLIDGNLPFYAKEECEKIYVGKRRGVHSMEQEEIHQLLISHARQGKRVVRLKGGDSFVFGRGGEECIALCEAGISVEVVPGVSSCISVPEIAGIPITHRGVARSFTVVTGHPLDGEDFGALASLQGTLVFLMAHAHMREITEKLLAAGKNPNTPASVISKGCTPDMKRVDGSLFDIAVRASDLSTPSVLVVGEVAGFHLIPDSKRTRKVLVTGTRKFVKKAMHRLADLDMKAVGLPCLSIEPLFTGELESFEKWDWFVFTSMNGVDLFFKTYYAVHKNADARAFADKHFACIGPGTASELFSFGIRAELVSKRHTCGVHNKAPKERYVKLLDFRHFERHMMFSRSDKKEKKKAISDGVNVSVVMEL